MKVLAVNSSPRINGSLLGGMELWRHLRYSGHRVLVAMDGRGTGARAVMESGIECRDVDVPQWWCGFKGGDRGPHLRAIARFLRHQSTAQLKLESIIVDNHIDVVYANTAASVIGIMAARSTGVPVVCHVRERIDESRMFGRAHAQFLANHCSGIVTNSRCSSVPFDSIANVEMIYDGVAAPNRSLGEQSSIDLRVEWGVADSDLLLVALGTYSEAKGHGLLLRAAPRILASSPNAKFIFVGGAPRVQRRLRSAFSWGSVGRGTRDPHQIVHRLGIGSAVRFVGWAENVEAVIEAADVVVFPSRIHEGFGRPLGEAGLFARPVVAFNVGAAPEIVDDGYTGLLAPHLTSDSLAESVILLLQSQELRASCGAAGRARILQHFSMSQHLSRVSRVLLDQVGQNRRPTRVSVSELLLPRGR